MSGFVAFAGCAPDPDHAAALQRASAKIAHRGDIEATVWLSDRSGAAGRYRERAGFRVHSHVGERHALMLDGLVVNETELRNSAAVRPEAGVAELVLAGFEKFGDGWFEKLDGSFAVFLVDLDTGDVLLARDRFGHRPLYFAVAQGTIWAGSEIKALLAAPGVRSSLNRAALPAAIGYGVTPGPETLFDGIYKCVPGFAFRITSRGTHAARIYYRPPAPQIYEGTLQEAQEHVGSELRARVSRYVRECPGVGVLLSGGVDSALLASQLAEVTGGRAPAISFGAAEWDQEESADAQAIAQQIGMPFSRMYVGTQHDFAGALREVVRQLEEPTRFENAVALALTFPTAAAACTAVLTGEGGDSTFGTWEHLQARRVAQAMTLPRVIRLLLAAVPEPFLRGRQSKALAAYCRADSIRDYVLRGADNCRDLVRGAQHPPPLALQESVGDVVSCWPPAAAFTYAFLLQLMHCWVERMEKLASLHGLECFHPFQSNALLDFGLALPERLRILGGHTKPILRGLVQERLGNVRAYCEKRQLAAPMNLWLNRSQQLREMVLRLKDPGSRIRDWLDNGAIDRHLANYERHGANTALTSRTVFRLLSFELWLEMFG